MKNTVMWMLALCLLAGAGRLGAEDPILLRWTFEYPGPHGYSNESGSEIFEAKRLVEPVDAIVGKGVKLSRLDALRYKRAPELVADGVFAIHFWAKVEWSSRRYGHGDILNYVTASPDRPWVWRVGFEQVTQRQLPRGAMPLVLQIGEDFSTAEQPLLVEPWQWTHVAFVGTGEGVEVWRNGGHLGTVWYGEEGLPDLGAVEGTLQINGSPNYDVVPDGEGGVDREAQRTGVWENDLRFDELLVADRAARPRLSFADSLRVQPEVAAFEHELHTLDLDPRDRFIVGSLIRQARQIDNGADTRKIRADLVKRVSTAMAAARQGKPVLSTQRGRMKLSYWSEVDQSEQFYEVYVPFSWNGRGALPLVIALHGGGEDETVLFERYTLEERAEDKGWIVVCPYGRGQDGYRTSGQRDVFDVVSQVKRQWPIDNQRIYGFGHSMGAFGILNVATARPDYFAAIAPIAGWWDVERLGMLSQLPVLWIIGDQDFLYEGIKPQLAAVDKMAAAGAPHVTQVLEGFDHGGFLGFTFPTVVEVSLPRIFDFFAEHERTR